MFGIEFFTGAGATVGVEYLVAVVYMWWQANSTNSLAAKALAEIEAGGSWIGKELKAAETRVAGVFHHTQTAPVVASPVAVTAQGTVNVAPPNINAMPAPNTGVVATSATTGVFTDIKRDVQAVANTVEADTKSVVAKAETLVSEVVADVSAKEQAFLDWFKNRGKANATATAVPG